MQGWVKLYRITLESAIFDNANLYKVWSYCMMKASHKEHKLMVGNQLVELKAGEFVFGRKRAAIELKMSESTTWRYMKKLEKLESLNINSNNKFSIINIVNWGKYQDENGEDGQQTEQQMNNKWTTDEQQVDTNKNVKNDKNEKNDKNKDTIDSDFEKLWELYPNKQGKSKALVSYKKAIKDGVTNKAIQDGILTYSNHVRVNQTDKKYIKHGSTFFNSRAWEDDYNMSKSNPVLGFTEAAPSDPKDVVHSDETLKFVSEAIDKGDFTPEAEDIPKINDWRRKNGLKELDQYAKN